MTDILITRAEAQAKAFAAELEAALPGRFSPLYWPLIRIVPEAVPVRLDGIQALLFTSANAVRVFAAMEARRDLPALCVGDETARVAQALGFAAESAHGNAGDLARMAAGAWLPGAGAYLHLRGREAAGDLAGALMSEGIEVREQVVYDAQPAAGLPEEVAVRLVAGDLPAILFFSPRSARIFESFHRDARTAGQGWALGGTDAICISAATAAPLGQAGFGRIRVAPSPDRAGMLAALGQMARTVAEKPA